ncbi:MAG TPA: hypothetical protein DCM68_00835 [Verrucomicrobia bacterium]|nr:hypothetical protein [Verrucomicrobiota bacterium]
MKLLMLTWNYPPTVGGIEQVAYYTATSLRDRGHSVDIVAAALPPNAQEIADPAGAPHRARKKGIPAFLVHAFCTGLKLARRHKPDALLCASLTAAPAAWLISKLTRIPYVVLIYGSDLVLPRRLYQWAIGPLLSGARRLFPISQNTMERLVRRGLDPSRIRLVSPGVTPPPPATASPGDSIVRLMKELQGRPVLLTVGRLVRRKGILEFIEQVMPLLAARIPDLAYLVVGGEPKSSLIHQERIWDQLTDAIQKGGHENRVKLLGRLSDADLGLVYQQSSLFILPCRDDPADIEGFGIVILEASLHGVPSVATRCGGIPDAIAEGQTGVLVPPGRPQEMAEAILDLLQRPDRRREMGEAARQRTLSEFGWDAVAARYEAGLQEMLAARRP